MKIFPILGILFAGMLLITSAHSSTTSNDFKGTWAGIEVMGVESKTAERIRNRIPIHQGETFSSLNKEKLKSWCNLVKEEVRIEEVNCSFVGFANGNFFYSVEIIAPNSKSKKYRIIPKTIFNIASIPKEIEELSNQWEERAMFLIKSEINPQEYDENGYLDSKDPLLHELAIKLSNETHKYNNKLLNIIKYSKDPKNRSKAATLLSWSKQPSNLEFILKWDLLSDPDEEVRNNLARSMFVILNKVKEKSLLRKSLQSFCYQASLPSHTDRNKALTSLQKILKKNPDLVQSINKECKATISYIGHNSILPNAGGVAIDLLNTLENSKNG